jgi:hypothetical protein
LQCGARLFGPIETRLADSQSGKSLARSARLQCRLDPVRKIAGFSLIPAVVVRGLDEIKRAEDMA